MKMEREPARAGGSAEQKVVLSVNHIEANEVTKTAVAHSTGLYAFGASFLGFRYALPRAICFGPLRGLDKD
jgi:hypothetical protein